MSTFFFFPLVEKQFVDSEMHFIMKNNSLAPKHKAGRQEEETNDPSVSLVNFL